MFFKAFALHKWYNPSSKGIYLKLKVFGHNIRMQVYISQEANVCFPIDNTASIDAFMQHPDFI